MSKKQVTNGPDNVETGRLLWQVGVVWERAINAELREYDLTHVHVALMAGIEQLTAGGEALTQTRLASATRTDVMMTSKALRALEARGLVRRKEHPDDTRARSVSLTREGSALLRKATKAAAKVDAEVFGGVTGLDKIRKAALGLLGDA